MKDLDFQSRTILARECIEKVFVALNPNVKVRKVPNTAPFNPSPFIGATPNLHYGNREVNVSVNIEFLTITDANTGEILFNFQLSLVSFASKGDDDVNTCVAFVAKDNKQGRACYVLKAASTALAKELIGALGQAFELKFNSLVEQRNVHQPQPRHPAHTEMDMRVPASAPDSDYVNDSMESHGTMKTPDPSSPIQLRVKQGVHGQSWFHGPLSRDDSEARLLSVGDFLVRESVNSPGQFILSGLTEYSGAKHLLLVDPDGQVRTRDRHFLSVAHLVNHHLSSSTPIISQDTEIFLKHPVSVHNFE